MVQAFDVVFAEARYLFGNGSKADEHALILERKGNMFRIKSIKFPSLH